MFICLKNDVIIRKEADGAILRKGDGPILFTNEKGALILKYCNGFYSTSQIKNLINISEKEFLEFLDWLHENDLLKFNKNRQRIEVFPVEKPQPLKNSSSFPIRVSIAITNKCNLNCKHCYARANEKKI